MRLNARANDTASCATPCSPPRRLLLACVVLALVWTACTHPSQPPSTEVELAKETVQRCQVTPLLDEEPAIASYWPAGTFASRPDDIIRRWYSAELCAMGEAPLVAPRGRDAVRLRFLWLRSFHPSISVRVESNGRHAQLVAVELAKPNERESPGRVARRERRDLEPGEWAAIDRAIEQSGLWQMRSEPHECCDGARWVFEIVEEDRRRVVDRWSGDDLEGLGRLLLRLSGLEPREIY